MNLKEKKIALIATDYFEDSELTNPMEALINAGAEVTVVSNKPDEIVGEQGTRVSVDKTVDEVNADNYDGLVIPGGVKNPDIMRTNKKAIQFVKDFFNQHKPVAAICHGPWLLVEADVVKGRTLTSWPSLTKDITNAGGNRVDKEVVVDEGLITSRKPDDLMAFCTKMVKEFAEGKHRLQIAA